MTESNEENKSSDQIEQEKEEKYLQGMNKKFEKYKKLFPIALIATFISIAPPFLEPQVYLGLPSISDLYIIIALKICYMYTFRRSILNPFRIKFSLQRKIIATWTNRLLFISLVASASALKLIPGIGHILYPISGLILIVANTYCAFWYHRWHYKREIEDQGLLLIEKIILLGVFGIFGFCVFSIVVVLFILGTITECIVDKDCSVMQEVGNFFESIF